jgi:transcriptional regulator with XRE-family HTH domain
MLGPRIAALRRAAGISQSELAQMLKISPSAVGMYEQGRREPALDILAAMANIFGVTIDFLVTGKAGSAQEEDRLTQVLMERVNIGDARLNNRRVRPFSREELAVLFAAMLMEP